MDIKEKGEETTRASLELLYHISRELAAALDLRTVLQRVVLLSMQTVGAMSGSDNDSLIWRKPITDDSPGGRQSWG